MARTELTGKQIKDSSVDLAADVTGVLPVGNGGTGSDTLPINNVLLGNGSGALQAIAPGTSGNVLTSDGSTWASSAPAAGDAGANPNTLTERDSSANITANKFISTVATGTAPFTVASTTQVANLSAQYVSGFIPSTANTAGTLATRNADGNLLADAFVPSFSTTATAASNTTLTINSNQVQEFTGSTTQAVTLPTTGITAGHQFTIINSSSSTVTVNSSAAQAVVVLPAGATVVCTALVATPTTSAHWRGAHLMSLSSTAQASGATIASRDGNGNLAADLFYPGFTTTVTAAGTTTLTIDSKQVQEFTGSSTQTIVLPQASITPGTQFYFINNSTVTITILASGGATVGYVLPGGTGEVTALLAAPTTAAGWSLTKSATTANTGNSLVLRDSSGNFTAGQITGSRFISNISTGTSPFVVASQTQVTNLNSSTVAGFAPYSTAQVGSLAVRDNQANITADAFIATGTGTSTSSGTTTLTYDSTQIQVFGGTQTHTVKLPVSSIALGRQFTIVNNSTEPITVTASDDALVTMILPGYNITFTSQLSTPTTPAGWSFRIPGGHTNRVKNTPGDYTPVLEDANGLVVISFFGGFNRVLTVPTNASVPFPIGTVIDVLCAGSSGISFAAASGVTLLSGNGMLNINYNASNVPTGYSARLRKYETDSWMLSGDLHI